MSSTLDHLLICKKKHLSCSINSLSLYFLSSTGHPDPTVTWTHSGGPLSNDAIVETRLNKTVLTIPKVKQCHSGLYSCHIDNDAGSAQCTCDVIVKSECHLPVCVCVDGGTCVCCVPVDDSWVGMESFGSWVCFFVAIDVILLFLLLFLIIIAVFINSFFSPPSYLLPPMNFLNYLIFLFIPKSFIFYNRIHTYVIRISPKPSSAYVIGMDLFSYLHIVFYIVKNLVVDAETQFPPVISKRLQPRVLGVNERLHLEIDVTGTPSPTITWSKDGHILKPSDHVALKSEGTRHLLIIQQGLECVSLD